jgi:hypothetical protein
MVEEPPVSYAAGGTSGEFKDSGSVIREAFVRSRRNVGLWQILLQKDFAHLGEQHSKSGAHAQR